MVVAHDKQTINSLEHLAPIWISVYQVSLVMSLLVRQKTFLTLAQRQQRQVLATSLEMDDRMSAGMGVKLMNEKVWIN